jgi:hypothetical protein
MGYANLDQTRERFRIPDTLDDARLSMLIDTASAMIDKDTNSGFGQTTATKTFVPSCAWEMGVPPLISITTLKTDDDASGTYETTWTTSDYELDGGGNLLGTVDPYTLIRAIGSATFPTPVTGGRHRLVQIVGSWGYPVTPDAIIEATMLLVSRLWHRAGSPLGVQSFGDIGVGYVRSSDPDYWSMISPYINYETD